MGYSWFKVCLCEFNFYSEFLKFSVRADLSTMYVASQFWSNSDLYISRDKGGLLDNLKLGFN